MGSSGMGARLAEFVKKQYPDSKSDLFAVFMERGREYTKANGYLAMITQHAWMFLSSFEKLRAKLMEIDTVNMAHLGARAFEEIGGEVVQTTAFVMQNRHVHGFKGMYARLIEPTTQDGKEEMFLDGKNRFSARQDNFEKIPGAPVAYWVSEKFIEAFEKGKKLSAIAEPKQGLKTGDNDTFLRLWFEPSINKFSIRCGDGAKWYPCNKGGEYRLWYGNNDYVIDWENDGYKLKNFRHADGRQKSRPQNLQYMKKEGLTYTNISSGNLSVRYSPDGFLFDAAGSMIFCEKKMLFYILGFMTSKVALSYTSVSSPTMTFEVGQLASLPLMYKPEQTIDKRVNECIQIEKEDWDSFETSWDFKRHPLV